MTYIKQLESILADIAECAAWSLEDQMAFTRYYGGIPPSINLGDNKVLYVSDKSVRAIRNIAHTYRQNSAEVTRALSEDETHAMVSSSIGSIMRDMMAAPAGVSDKPIDPTELWVSLRTRLEESLKDLDRELTHLFGGWVLQGTEISFIDIGRVRFSTKAQWLSDAISAGVLTDVQATRISYHWQHGHKIEVTPDEGFEGHKILAIADAINSCPWVCSVRVPGHAPKRSRQKALLAARIAFAAISLTWSPRPSIQAKECGLFFDLGPTRMRSTATFIGNWFEGASRETVFRIGHFLRPEDAPTFTAESTSRLKSVGSALEAYLSPTPAGRLPKMHEALCHALIWYYEATHEPLEFTAIVKYVAVLDTLANGGKSQGICQLIQRRFPVADPHTPFLKDGTTLKALGCRDNLITSAKA